MHNDKAETALASAGTPRSRGLVAVGVWQLATGAIAAVSWLTLATRMRTDSPGLDLIVAGGVLLALLSLGAGYGLVRRRPGAVLPSLCVQALQIVGFTTGPILYQLTLGPYVDLTILWGQRVALIAGFQPRLSLAVNPHAIAPTGFAVNLLACILLLAVLFFAPEDARSASEGVPGPNPRIARPGS